MLKRGTWLLLVSAIALTGGVLLLENRAGDRLDNTSDNTAGNAPGNATETEGAEQLFPFEEDDIEQFSVLRTPEEGATEEGATEESAELSFQKDDDGTWRMVQPKADIAQAGAIAFLLSQVTTTSALPVEREIDEETGEPASLAPFGLLDPLATVSMTANGSDYLLHIGGLDFASDRRYVQTSEIPAESDADSTEESAAANTRVSQIYLISAGIITAVNRPTEDWLLADDINTNNSPKEADIEEPAS